MSNIFAYLEDDENEITKQSTNQQSIIYKNSSDKILYDTIISKFIDYDHEYFKTSLLPPSPSIDYCCVEVDEKYPETAFIDLNNNTIVPTLVDKNIPASYEKIEYNLPNHWGQRKLLLSEINFLNEIYKGEKIIVIYAGAAPGTHIPILLDMFPNVEYHLYDPKPFDKNLENKPNIKINLYYNVKKSNKKLFGSFSNEVAFWYADNYKETKLYFISDIRTIPKYVKNSSIDLLENEILKNQNDQMNWICNLNAELSMLKFKVPYPAVNKEQFYKYIKGKINFQIWTPTTSSETRLIVSKSDLERTCWYDIIAYERKLAYYNFLRQHSFNDFKIQFLDNITLKDFYKDLTNNIDEFTIDFYNEILLLRDYYYKYISNIDLPTFLKEKIIEITTRLNNVYIMGFSEEETEVQDYSKFFRVRKTYNDTE